MISTANKVLGLSMARRRTRRWLVAGYWCLVAILTAVFFAHQAYRSLTGFAIILAMQMLINLPALLGGVRAGGAVKPYRGVKWAPLLDRDDVQTVFGPPKPMLGGNIDPDSDLDEREYRDRDHVHFMAYTAMRWIALALFGAYLFFGVADSRWFGRVGPLFLFLLTFLLWSLPQTMILWSEPDLEAAP